MAKFLVIEEGRGEGCDYAIGCNTRVWSIEADSMDSLLHRLDKAVDVVISVDVIGDREAPDDWYDDSIYMLAEHALDRDGGDLGFKSIRIVPGDGVTEVNIPQYVARADAACAAYDALEKERGERAKLAELQAKYG